MNHLKKFHQLNESIKDDKDLMAELKGNLIDGSILYHYTLVENLDDIFREGLKSNKNPNYKDGSKAVFLTNKESVSDANVSHTISSALDDFYDEVGDDDYNEEDKPVVRIHVRIDNLDMSKFTWDDDYAANLYKWNKADTRVGKIAESLYIWGTIAYLDDIPKENIVDSDFYYLP